MSLKRCKHFELGGDKCVPSPTCSRARSWWSTRREAVLTMPLVLPPLFLPLVTTCTARSSPHCTSPRPAALAVALVAAPTTSTRFLDCADARTPTLSSPPPSSSRPPRHRALAPAPRLHRSPSPLRRPRSPRRCRPVARGVHPQEAEGPGPPVLDCHAVVMMVVWQLEVAFPLCTLAAGMRRGSSENESEPAALCTAAARDGRAACGHKQRVEEQHEQVGRRAVELRGGRCELDPRPS